MSKLKGINNITSNESPYKLFSSGNNITKAEIKPYSKSTSTPHNFIPNKNKKNLSILSRPFSSKTNDDQEVSSISKKLKSMTLSNESYTNYINYYSSLTQDYTFKTPRVSSYPLRKNQKYLPITSQNFGSSSTSTGGQDSFFLNFMKETEQNSNKFIETKPYGFKYGNTKIRIDIKRAKSAYPTINPKDFQNLCETNIFESELLNQIGLKNIDMYNSLHEKNKNFEFFNNYLEIFNEINDLFNYDNSYKNIKFHAKTSIIKKTVNFQLEIYSLCFKFYLLGNKEKPQKLYFPFKLLPLFYLLDFQLFKVFLSEILYYDEKNKCLAYIQNNLLLNNIKKYYNFISNTINKDTKYKSFMTYNKNELLFYLIYDWIISNKNNEEYKCYKLKITLPKIKFYIDTYNIKIIKHLNKHIIANIIINDFREWEKFILFDLFSNKRFKIITNLIMLNKQNVIKENKIYLNRDPNKHLLTNKRFEFFITENGDNFSNFYIFVPYIILVIYGERKKRYQKINLSWNESKNLVKFKQHWGIINTLLKCMFIDTATNEIFFKLNLLDNIDNDLYKVIIQENSNSKLNSILAKKNNHNIFYGKKNSSKNNLIHIKEKDKDKDKNKTKYKTNNLEISLLECSFKKINISDTQLESKYYKIPENFMKCIFSIKKEKDLFNSNFNDISIIGKCIGECSNNIINAPEENIIDEEEFMKKRAKDNPSINRSLFRISDKTQSDKSPRVSPAITNKLPQKKFNRFKTFKIMPNGQKSNNDGKMLDRIDEKPKKLTRTEIKSDKHVDEIFNLKINEEYAFGLQNSKIYNKAISIKNVKDLNKCRIKTEYNEKDEYKITATNKY